MTPTEALARIAALCDDAYIDCPLGDAFRAKVRAVLAEVTPETGVTELQAEADHLDAFRAWLDRHDAALMVASESLLREVFVSGWEAARTLGRPACARPVAIDRDALRRAVAPVIWNASNYPRKAQPYILGQDTGPLTDAVVAAVAAWLEATT